MNAGLVLALVAKRPWPALLSASLSGWVAMYGFGHALLMPDICGALASSWPDLNWRKMEAVLLFNPPERLALSWLLMLVAMMPPLLAEPVMHLWVRSMARRRLRAVAAFVIAYVSVWMAAGIVLLAVAVAIRVSAGGSEALAVALALAVASMWQFARGKQTSLDRCHELPRLSAFGLAADLDCLRYGLGAGVWCIGACWALMLLPLVGGEAHVPLMAAVSALLIIERLAPTRSRSRVPWFCGGFSRGG